MIPFYIAGTFSIKKSIVLVMTEHVLSSTAAPDLEEVAVGDVNGTGARLITEGIYAGVWRCVWPPLCVTGFVGNALVLLVLRRKGLVKTSANVYLSALAICDTLVLAIASLVIYSPLAWGVRLDATNEWTCRALWPAHHTLSNASMWIIVMFTVERFIAVRFPLQKLRKLTPRKASVWCASILLFAFVKNIDLFFVFSIVDRSSDTACGVSSVYMSYMKHYRSWITLIIKAASFCVVFLCNCAIIWELRRKFAANDGLPRATLMCLSVSLAFIICVIPENVVRVANSHWPISPQTRDAVYTVVLLLRYASHAINFFLYSLTGAHFRRELVTMLCHPMGKTVHSIKFVLRHDIENIKSMR